MMKRLLLLCALFLLGAAGASAQVNTGIARRLVSYSTPPSCTTALKGFIYFDTDDNTSYLCNGTSWGAVSTATVPGSNNQVLTSDGAGALVAESGLTYDGSTLAVTGTLTGPTNLVYNSFSTAPTMQPTADVRALNLKCFNGTNTASVFRILDKTDATLFDVDCSGTFTYGPSGSAYALQSSLGTPTTSASSTGKFAFHSTWNKLAWSYNTGAYQPFVLGPATNASSGNCAEWDASGNLVDSGGTCGGGSNPFSDATALVMDNSDNTKLLLLEVSGITTGTTRTWTVPNRDLTVAGTSGTLTNGQVARFDSNGNLISPATSGTVVLTSATTSALTIQTGNVTSTNNGAAMTIDGSDNTSASTGSAGAINMSGGDQTAAATGGNAGTVAIRGGDSAGNGSTTAGSLTIRPGGGSAATPSVMGRLVISETYGDGGTVTSGNMQCAVGNLTVADCGTSATNALGLAISASDTNPVIVQWAGRNNVAMTLDVASAGRCDATDCTTSVGDYVCTSANTAGRVQVATGPTTAPCAANRVIGRIVIAETDVIVLAIGAVSLRVAN